MPESRRAALYRMILPDHECPFGRRARQMLDDAGYEIDEHILRTREDVEAAKDRFGVATTPVIIIDGQQIDGSDHLQAYLQEA